MVSFVADVNLKGQPPLLMAIVMEKHLRSRRTGSPALTPVPVLLLLVSVILCGCVSVKLIADYDAKLDDGVTALQKKTETLLVRLERVIGSPAGDCTNFISNYDDIRVDLSSLQVRADALAYNRLTAEQLSLLRDSLEKIEERHRTNGLRPLIVEESRKALNRQFAAILKLEVAKKRDAGAAKDSP